MQQIVDQFNLRSSFESEEVKFMNSRGIPCMFLPPLVRESQIHTTDIIRKCQLVQLS